MPPKTSTTTSRMPPTSSGLSAVPTSPMAASATGPGVSRMTRSATATTGASRIESTDAVR